MESSSENSFTWTDTSKDSTDSESMAPDENDNTKSPKHGKKRKAKEISGNSYNGIEEDDDSEIKVKIEKEHAEVKNENKKRKVKVEPESECDVPKKKKKKNKDIVANGTHDTSQDSYDESHLNLKVKEEQISESSSKKKKKKISLEPNNTDNSEELKVKDNDSDIPEETVKHKKKKKKSKKKHDSEVEDAMEVDYKEDAEDSVINKSNSNSSENGTTGNSFTESNTFQDDSGCEEISAIQCDGDNSHTISFNDSQPKVKDSKKKSETLLKNTIVNQFKIANNVYDSPPQSGKRTPRLSDRIQFEDDDAEFEHSDIQENREEEMSSKLKKFFKTNNDIKLVSQTLENNSLITEDDEIWIVKCPNEIDIQDFCNTDLNLDSKCKIKVGGLTYEGSLEEGISDTVAALSSKNGKCVVRNLPLCGNINVRKRIPKAHFRIDNMMINNQTNFIPLPDIKCRHPLFGSNYKKAIKVPSAVASRLNAENNETSDIVEKKKKKKPKKDKSALEHEETDSSNKCLLKSEPTTSPEVTEKKKKKRKHVDDADVVDGPAPKKVKRIKHDPESAEAWESEKAIEDNLFNF